MQNETSTMLAELPHLSVFVYLWTKEDRDAIDCCLQCIMHALTKASPYISITTIAINRGKKTEAINDETVIVLNPLTSLKSGVANRRALELGLNRA